MGLFKRILGRDFEKLSKRGDDMLKEGQFGLAKMAYEDALKSSDKDTDPDAVEKIRNSLDKAKTALAKSNFEEAEGLVQMGDFEGALKLLDVCRELLDTNRNFDEKSRKDFDNRMESLENMAIQGLEQKRMKRMSSAGLGQNAEAGPGAGDEADGFGDTQEDRFEILLGSLPLVQAEEYRSLGQEFARAYLLMNEGNMNESRQVMEKLLEEKPGSIYLQYEVARLKSLTGELEPASKLYEKILQVEDDIDPEVELKAVLELADCKSKLGQHEAAEEDVLAALAVHPDRVDVMVWLARILRRAGETGDALAAVTKAFNMDPQEIACHAEMALCLDNTGKSEDASEHALAVIASGTGVMDLEENELNRILELAGVPTKAGH
ncbi:MAG: tetratricopeptide repeat protein [Deltaproteobacteria bacterium]|nr:tetratricopeptide repeat protein [Deltaproteobacteria bacterium]